MKRLLLAVMITLASPMPGRAQGVAVLAEGTRVWVTSRDGREHEGVVASSTSTDLRLRTDALVERIALADVRRIEARDRLGNGVRNGAIAGAAAMGGFGLFLSHALCESSDGCLRNDLGPLLRIAALGAGLGMAAGALVDAAIKGRRVIYEASPPSAINLTVTPDLGARRIAARVTFTWPATDD